MICVSLPHRELPVLHRKRAQHPPQGAELLYVDVSVEPVGFNRGYFTVDCTYFYRVTGGPSPEARPARVCMRVR